MIYNTDPLPLQYHILYKGEPAGVKGTRIEQYYSDYKHIRIVPFSAVAAVKDLKSEKLFGKDIYDYTCRLAEGQKTDENFVSAGYLDGSANSMYRRIIKMHWLINSISKEKCEPITVSMSFNIHEHDENTFQQNVHPGSFRKHAFKMADRDDDCIVFDPFCIFPDYPKASLSDIISLYDTDNTILEIALMPSERDMNTPQILNMHQNAKNTNMSKNLKAWEEKTRHMWDKPINIFIGYDSTHKDATYVCHNSIQDNISPHLNKFLKIHHIDVTKIHGWTREYANQSTEFTYTRFLVPYLSNYEGMSIFVDDDFIFTENILSTLFFMDPDCAVACVKHNFEHKYNTKFTNTKDVWYDKKLWSSLMVFNNSHPDCQKLTLDTVMTESGKYLHGFEWTDAIAELPKKWNWCEGYSDLNEIHNSFGLHFTRGGPWIDDMDTSDIEALDVYDSYKIFGHEGFDKWRTVCDLRNYYDLDNPIEITNDESRICQEINRDIR